MKLFDFVKNELTSFSLESYKIQTSLGKVVFEMSMGDFSTRHTEPFQAYKVEPSGRILCWENELFRLELFIKPITPHLPNDMEVDSCHIGVWRIHASKDLAYNCVFLCNWEKGYDWTNYGPNSGEHLDAQTWDDGEKYVTIGTEDGIMLSARAFKGDRMPSRFENEIADDFVQYEPHGLSIPIPQLEAGEECQIHFVVSCGTSELATWYAVDFQFDEIANELNNG